MKIRSLILCEDVRFEMGGTFSLIGVQGDRLFLPPGEGPIVLPKLALFLCVSGLLNIETLSWRYHLALEDDEPGVLITQGQEPHDPTAEEHHLISIFSPIHFAAPGSYLFSGTITAAGQSQSFQYYLSLHRPAAQPHL